MPATVASRVTVRASAQQKQQKKVEAVRPRRDTLSAALSVH